MSSQAESWWLKNLNFYTPQLVRIINQATQPLLITSCEGTWPLGDELSLSHMLAPKVRLQLVKESNIPQISHSFSDVFFYNPPHNPFSQEFLSKLEKQQKYKIENVYPKKLELWKLAK